LALFCAAYPFYCPLLNTVQRRDQQCLAQAEENTESENGTESNERVGAVPA
jgi:hypothetical protein